MWSPLLTTRRERALRCALGWWQAVCRRLLDEASTAGAVAAPCRSAATQTMRRWCARARSRLARRCGGRCRLLTNGSSRVSRRRATRHSVKMGAVRSVRDGWARGAARSGPLMERKLRALREALSAIPARAGRSRAPIGAARTGRSNRRKPVVGAAADNLQTRQPHQARIALQT